MAPLIYVFAHQLIFPYGIASAWTWKTFLTTMSNLSQNLENGLQSHFPRNSLEKLKKCDFYSILFRQEKAACSSPGHDILFLNAQRHILKGPSINFSIWYRVNMDLKKFFDNHVQPLSEASKWLPKAFPKEILGKAWKTRFQQNFWDLFQSSP